MNTPEEFHVPDETPQEFWCNDCDNVIVKSKDPATGKFFSAFGHQWHGVQTKDPLGDYHMIVWATCSVCLGAHDG